MDVNLINKIFTLTSTALVIFLGGLVLFKDKQNKNKIIFFLLTIVLSGWLFSTFMLLGSDDLNKIFWDKMVYYFVVFIPAFLYHFIHSFTKKGKLVVVFCSYLVSLFFLITILFTNSFIDGVFEYEWGIHLKAGFFHHVFLLMFFTYSLETYRLLFLFYREVRGKIKKQTLLLFLGFLSFGTIGFLGFLPAYEISIYPISHFSALIFVLAISYAITKYNLLGIKIFTIYFLIVALNMVAFTHIFISKDLVEYIVEGLSFVLVLVISYLLHKSFQKEVKQKEHLKKATKNLKKANVKIEKTNKKLKELDKAKNEFLSVAAHQLRTPATAVKGYTAMILDGNFGKCDKRAIEALEKVYKANERMTNLIEDLLTTSRIESGHLKYEFTKVNIQEILEELENTFAIRTKEKKLKFSIKYPKKALPKIVADRNKIREVISNIIDNAIKYTPKGSVKISVEKEDEFIKITVEDTGRGMTERTKDNLFEKFTRGQESSSEVEGTGLGLFVVKSLVEKHGGTITAHSEGLDKGSKFIMKLPIKRKIEDEDEI